MADMRPKLDSDLNSIREELNSRLSEIERGAREIVTAEANNTITTAADTDEGMDVSVTDYTARMLVIEKETQELCQRMTGLLTENGPDFPRSHVLALHSLVQSWTAELKSKKLTNVKAKQQREALQNKIDFLEVQRISLEKALKGIRKSIDEVDQENVKAAEILQKTKEEFAETRKDLHDVIRMLFPDDDDRMRNLLADLTKARFSETEEKWVDVREHYFPHVELLHSRGIIEEKSANCNLFAFTF